MGLMKTAAVKGIIPAGNKVSELRSNLGRLMIETAIVMEERFGKDGLDAVAEVFRRLGNEDAIAMKETLGLGNTLRDALDAWIVIGHVMGAKMKPRWISDNRVETDHPYCPQHEGFLKKGKLYCESLCWPYVSAVAEGIAPGVKMEVPKPATMDATCTKALVYSPVKSD